MLPQFYRIIVVNNSGQTLTYNNNGRINVKLTAWYYNPATGKMVYAALGDDACSFAAASTLVAAAEALSSEINNTANLYLGLQVQLEITHDEGAAAVGTFDLYLDGGDATGELSSDASGYDTAKLNGLAYIGSLTWQAAMLDDELGRSIVYEIGG